MTTEYVELQAEVFRALRTISEALPSLGRIRCKPLLGGSFGTGRYYLATYPTVQGGLDTVHHFVIEAESRAVLAYSAQKSEVLANARNVITKIDPTQLAIFFASILAERNKKMEQRAQEAREVERERKLSARTSAKVRSIPKRRKQIFNESNGQCHYCSTPLALDGRWHIDHKMPKALGGDNSPGNLVASCAPCNHAKRDTTDVEFKAKRANGGQS